MATGVPKGARNQTRVGGDGVVPVGPHPKMRVPDPVFTGLPCNPTAASTDGVVPFRAPSGGDLETGSSCVNSVQFEPVACARGSVHVGPDGRNIPCSDSFIFQGAPKAGEGISPRVAAMRPIVEDSVETLEVDGCHGVALGKAEPTTTSVPSSRNPVTEEAEKTWRWNFPCMRNGGMWWRSFVVCTIMCQFCFEAKSVRQPMPLWKVDRCQKNSTF